MTGSLRAGSVTLASFRPLVPLGAAALTAALLLLTCTNEPSAPDPSAVAAVVILPDSGAVDTGDSLHLAATVRNAEGAALAGKAVVWTSLDTATAVVTAAGRVDGVWPGRARIVATSEGVADTAPVRVLARITAIALTPSLDTL